METQKAISDYERERGKPIPSKHHSRIQIYLGVVLLQHEPPFTSFSELTLDLNGNWFTPDLSVYRESDISLVEEEVRMSEPPVLAIEIASPTQGTQELVDKARELLRAGVQSCWLIQPALRILTVFSSSFDDGKQKTYGEGTVTDPATGIKVDLADLFASMA